MYKNVISSLLIRGKFDIHLENMLWVEITVMYFIDRLREQRSHTMQSSEFPECVILT